MAGKKARISGAVFRKLVRSDIYIVDGLAADIKAALSLKEDEFVEIGVEILLDTVNDFDELLDLYFGSDIKRMSGPEEKGKAWYEEPPAGIVESLRLAVCFYESYIHTLNFTAESLDEDVARQLDSKRVYLMRKLAFTVQVGKKTIEKDDPSFWNQDLETEFRTWLEYRLA